MARSILLPFAKRLYRNTLAALASMLIDPASGAAREIPVELPGCSVWLRGWTPNGERLVFGSVADQTFDTYSVRTDGSDLRLIAAQAYEPQVLCAAPEK
jgi:hypothetical protein